MRVGATDDGHLHDVGPIDVVREASGPAQQTVVLLPGEVGAQDPRRGRNGKRHWVEVCLSHSAVTPLCRLRWRSTAVMMNSYPVHRQSTPASSSRISSRDRTHPLLASAGAVIRKTGGQN